MAAPHDGATLALPPVLNRLAAASLALELDAFRGRPLSLDASKVERLGGLGLQLLLSARKTWATQGLPFTIDDRSPAFDDALVLSGAAFEISSDARS